MKLVRLAQTCRACPSQWEGETVDGQAVYVRYRHGMLSWCVAASLDEAIEGNGAGGWQTVGGPWDGTMSTHEMLVRTGSEVRDGSL